MASDPKLYWIRHRYIPLLEKVFDETDDDIEKLHLNADIGYAQCYANNGFEVSDKDWKDFTDQFEELKEEW